jgi:hypothetical protein
MLFAVITTDNMEEQIIHLTLNCDSFKA